MARRKASAPYWIQPRTKADQSEPPHGSPRLRKEEASNTEQTLATNSQSASLLFKVPPEIRDYIFKLALTTYEDPTKPCNVVTQVPNCYQGFFPHNRPGHYHHLRTDTALLRTCRLVYNETALLPVSVNTHTLCYTNCPPPVVAPFYFRRMTSTQLAAVQHIQIFADRICLTAQDPGRYISYSVFAELGCLRGEKGKMADGRVVTDGIAGPYPRTMTITIRNCDWRFCNPTVFNLDNMLGNRHWETVLGGLKELRMELEIEDKEKGVLVPVINKLKEFEFDIGRGELLVAEENVKESGWMGPIDRSLGHTLEGPKWEETKYYVATLVWKMRSVSLGSAG